MKRGNEIGLITIKTVNKEGTDDLKELHYAINDLMYKYNRRYVSVLDAKSILSQLAEFGEALKEIQLSQKAKPKRDELLKSIREVWIKVNQYHKGFSWSDSDIPQIQATINFQVKKLVDAKSDGTLSQFPIKYLDENKEIYDRMVIDSKFKDRLKLDTFIEFNEQLINVVIKKYSFE